MRLLYAPATDDFGCLAMQKKADRAHDNKYATQPRPDARFVVSSETEQHEGEPGEYEKNGYEQATLR